MSAPAPVLCLLCVTLAACASIAPTATTPTAPAAERAASTPEPAPGAAPDRAVNPWGEPARDVLVQYCGTCHRSDLDTSIKGALAVFDLTEPVWYANLRPDQYDGVLERVHEASAIDPADVATVEAFVGCARGGDCPPRSRP